MRNKKKLILIAAIAAVVIAAAVIGVLSFVLPGAKGQAKKAIFTGVEDIHALPGTVTEQMLLEGVTATDLDGKPQEVTVDTNGADFSQPGMYTIFYKCLGASKQRSVYIHGPIQFKYNDEPITDTNLTVNFAAALTAQNFSKGVGAMDSFGYDLKVEKLDTSDLFDYKTGVYVAQYSVQDAAGQTAEIELTYTVISDLNMAVESDVSVYYSEDWVTFDIDLDGETEVWLMSGRDLIKSEYFTYTEDELTVYAEVYRAMDVGENTLLLCAINGSTEFTLEVLDSGTPVFTFDSLRKGHIFEGDVAAFDKPQPAIKGHEYTYEYRVVRDAATYKTEDRWLSYKATEDGSTVIFTTTDGDKLPDGKYNVTVTATNVNNKSKKATKTFSFRVYKDRIEVEGIVPSVDAQGATLTFMDMSRLGYGFGYNYVAHDQTSWKNRISFPGVNAGKYSYITFDFYVYENYEASEKDGPLYKVNGYGKTRIPFSTATSGEESPEIMFFDKAGNIKRADELMMNTWYTVRLDVVDLQKAKSTLWYYFGTNNQYMSSMYITDVNVYVYEQPEKAGTYKDDDKTVSITTNASKASLYQTKYDGESVLRYTVNRGHLPNYGNTRSLKITLLDEKKDVIKIQFKVLSATTVNGAAYDKPVVSASYNMWQDARWNAQWVVTDAAGNPTVYLKTNEPYTMYITTGDKTEFFLTPHGPGDEQILTDIIIESFETLDVPMADDPVTLSTTAYRKSAMGMYQTAEGNWQYSFFSFTDLASSYTNIPSDRPIYLNGIVGKQEVTFEFRHTISEVNGETYIRLQGDYVKAIMDKDGNLVTDQSTMVLGEWYTAVISMQDYSEILKSRAIYAQGWMTAESSGSKDNPANVMLEIRNVKAVEYKELPSFSDDPATMTISQNSLNGAKLVKDDSGLHYVTDADCYPNTIQDRVLKVTLTDTTKNVAKIQFKVNSATKTDGITPVNPVLRTYFEVWADTFKYDISSVVTDSSGVPVMELKPNEPYTLYITNALNKRSDKTVFYIEPLSTEGEKIYADILIESFQAVNAELTDDAVLTSTPYERKVFLGLYQDADQNWQYGIASYTALSWEQTNMGYERQITVSDTKGAGRVRFSFRFTVADGLGTADFAGFNGNTNRKFYDMDGNPVAFKDMQAGQWYVVDLFNVGALESAVCFYPSGSAVHGTMEQPVNVMMQVRDIKVYPVSEIHSFTNADGSVTIKQNAAFSSALIEDDAGLKYVIDGEHYPSHLADRSLKITLNDTTKNVIKIKFKVNSATLPDGTTAVKPILRAFMELYNSGFQYNINWVTTDEQGTPVMELETGKSYTIYITNALNDRADRTEFWLAPVALNGDKILADILFEDIQAVTADIADDDIVLYNRSYDTKSIIGLYQDKEDNWLYGYSSYVLLAQNQEISGTERGISLLGAKGQQAVRFEFRFTEATNIGTDAFKAFNCGNIMDYIDIETGKTVASKDMVAGKWYAGILLHWQKKGAPLNADVIYALTSAVNGTVESPVNVMMQIRNVKVLSPGAIEAVNVMNDTATLEKAAFTGASLTKDENGLHYVVNGDHYTTTAAARALTLKTKANVSGHMIKIPLTVNSITGIPTAVSVEGSESWLYEIVGGNKTPATALAAGKSYELYISNKASSTITIHLLGNNDVQVMADVIIGEFATVNIAGNFKQYNAYWSELAATPNGWHYVLNSTHTAVAMQYNSFNITFADTTKNVMKIQFQVKSAKLASDGTTDAVPVLRAFLETPTDAWLYDIGWVVTDATGTPVVDLALNQTYTMYITNALNGHTGTTKIHLLPLSNKSERICTEIVFESYEELKTELTAASAYLANQSGNTAERSAVLGVYQDAEGAWNYNFTSRTDLATGKTNEGWRRLIEITGTKGAGAVKFKVRFTEATINGVTSIKNFNGNCGNVIFTLNGETVETSDLVTNTWYDAEINQHIPTDANVKLYVLDSRVDGSATNPVNVVTQIKDITTYDPITSYTAGEGSVQKATVSGASLTQDTSGLHYVVDGTHTPTTAAARALKVTITDTTKEYIKIPFTVNSITGTPAYAEGVWVYDASGNAVQTITTGAYTMYVAVAAEQTEYTVDLLGNTDTQILAEVTIGDISLVNGFSKAINQYNASASALTKAPDGLHYVLDSAHTAFDMPYNSLNITFGDTTKNVMKIQFQVKSAKLASDGTTDAVPVLRAFLETPTDAWLYDIGWVVTDATGTPVVDLALNQTYTMYITNALNERTGTTKVHLLPLSNKSERINTEIVFKSYEEVKTELTASAAYLSNRGTDYEKYAVLGVYQDAEGAWNYNFTSRTDLATGKTNEGWRRLIEFKGTKGATAVKFKVRFTEATINGAASIRNFNGNCGNVIISLNGTTVATSDLVANTWYDAEINQFIPTDANVKLYVLNSAVNGSATNPVNAVVQIKDIAVTAS